MNRQGLQMGYNYGEICIQTALTSASQAENTGSNPVGATTHFSLKLFKAETQRVEGLPQPGVKALWQK